MAAIATGIRIGWRKAINLPPIQTTEPMMPMSTTTKSAESAAHMVLRCHGVGYLFVRNSHSLGSAAAAAQRFLVT